MRELDPRSPAAPRPATPDRPGADTRVFPFRRKVEQPRLRVLCFPYAGGAALLYRQWPELLPPAIDVCPVELPGRGLRISECPARDMASLCDALAPAIEPLCDGVPLALFGHSMGARVAFEIARRYPAHVVHLFASGSPAPGVRVRYDLPSGSVPAEHMTDLELTQHLRELGGTPPEILADDDLMARILPIVRADLVLNERYQADPEARLACPITVFAGIHDRGVSPSAAAAWQLRTAAAYRMVELEAGHFFLDDHRTSLIREIARDLAPRLA